MLVTQKQNRQNAAKRPYVSPRRAHKTVWDDAEIVVNIEYTAPGTALDDYLRQEQTRAALDLLAYYKQKLDKNSDAHIARQDILQVRRAADHRLNP